MKKILVVDESALFREYLGRKLGEYGLEVVVAVNGLDGTAKLRRELPDLVIMDCRLTRMSAVELLEEKRRNQNAAAIPVIVLCGRVERATLVALGRLHVKKILAKPVRIDLLVETVSGLLGVPLEMDSTPCRIEAHLNDDLLFVEVAEGLNRDKIDVLGYRIAELLDLYGVRNPKVLLMMSGVPTGPDESTKLEALFATVVGRSGAKLSHVRVLAEGESIRGFLAGRREYEGIDVVASLEQAMDGLIGQRAGSQSGPDEDRAAGRGAGALLPAVAPAGGAFGSIETRFSGDAALAEQRAVTVAIVDDDFVIRELVKAVLSDTPVTIREYENGRDFLADDPGSEPDLVFLDLMMPAMDGFEVMEELRRRGRNPPVCVLSALSRRETVMKASRFGVRSYLIKPTSPEAILGKARELLGASFP